MIRLFEAGYRSLQQAKSGTKLTRSGDFPGEAAREMTAIAERFVVGHTTTRDCLWLSCTPSAGRCSEALREVTGGHDRSRPGGRPRCGPFSHRRCPHRGRHMTGRPQRFGTASSPTLVDGGLGVAVRSGTIDPVAAGAVAPVAAAARCEWRCHVRRHGEYPIGPVDDIGVDGTRLGGAPVWGRDVGSRPTHCGVPRRVGVVWLRCRDGPGRDDRCGHQDDRGTQ
jgi:hypothetical protein